MTNAELIDDALARFAEGEARWSGHFIPVFTGNRRLENGPVPVSFGKLSRGADGSLLVSFQVTGELARQIKGKPS